VGNKKDTKLIILIVVLLVTCFGAYSTSAPKSITRKATLKQTLGPLQSFPTFEEIALEPQMVTMLDLDDHVFRNYHGPGGNVNLYVGYYYTTDKAYASHSPLACFPSQGWKISEPVTHRLTVGNQTISYVELTASIQGRNELILYWYQAGDLTTASVTKNKYNALYNKVRHKEEDHAFVRVSVPFADSGKEAAEKKAHQFIEDFYPVFIQIINSKPQGGLPQSG
jgi:EpsI family protein